jgi:hypothetical protein
MNNRLGRSATTLFGLVLLSTALFVFLGNKALSKTQTTAAGEPYAAAEENDCTYNFYRKDGDRLTPVSPSELDYADTNLVTDVTLSELDVATDETPPASRQVTITLDSVCVHRILNNCSTPQAGDAFVVTYDIEAPTKTIILEDGTLQTIYLLPSRVDVYVAVSTPNNNLLFLNRTSTILNQYFWEPVVFAGNMEISTFSGSLVGTLMGSNIAPGNYRLYTVMVPPGQSVYSNPDTYLSNLAELEFKYNVVQ